MDARDASCMQPDAPASILMTALATISGMTPIALGLESGSETPSAAGTVVIGGSSFRRPSRSSSSRRSTLGRAPHRTRWAASTDAEQKPVLTEEFTEVPISAID